MEVQYRQAFLKDLKQLKSSTSYQRIYELAFTTLENINLLEEIPDIKAMRGYNGRYRIRIGDYRIGIEVNGDIIEVMRVLHRREFYRYFP
ncbi:type II toxin-antitoxin system RelE/ParE family toxin [Dolichospermum sp. ST_con]|nr:type II toxin-antitoxin system RelE/ParE family toxin [Dolichospermum sp. ST_con]MDD1418304.1 type II toxin-antitoxin system RelE/ParE family toxin [Dolichospermum sp. ST_sed1]MDD1423144.1 type II toxin-antitoxin system RelE/ParE family toxin [Dolichospermum sp. ST_sed9]MDD1429552.1 type II toxin-antitoxin system RelE/ParE family toxin [Dolichospermum sp. ST_sed6]MDD1435059.1 type II toxin-antitoxin system RelE/ParE family toxin [Dolichospermum sp. ST_sed10]MDD1438878.1 type II toxin-antito